MLDFLLKHLSFQQALRKQLCIRHQSQKVNSGMFFLVGGAVGGAIFGGGIYSYRTGT